MKQLAIDTIENLARKFRFDNELSQNEPINVKSLVRKLNILTIYKPLSETFYGMSLKSPSGNGFILINSENPKGRQHFSVAHELYHLFFDENPTPHICNEVSGGKTPSERNADSFASALLLPFDGLLKCIPKEEILQNQVSLATIIRIEQYYSVSRSALLLRLKTKSLINSIEYNEFCKIPVQESARLYGYDTSLYNKGNEGLVIGDFGEKARYLYEKGLVSEGHYLELLNKITSNE